MSKSYTPFATGLAFIAIFLTGCSENKPDEPAVASTTVAEKSNFGNYESQVKWGEHLVTIGGCNG